MLQMLDVQVGDAISLGQSSFTIRKVLRYEPDRAGDMFSVAPRVMMNRADLDATGLITAGAFVSYRVLISGPRSSINSYRRAIKDSLHSLEAEIDLFGGQRLEPGQPIGQ